MLGGAKENSVSQARQINDYFYKKETEKNELVARPASKPGKMECPHILQSSTVALTLKDLAAILKKPIQCSGKTKKGNKKSKGNLWVIKPNILISVI